MVGARLPKQSVPAEVGTQIVAASTGTETGQGARCTQSPALQFLQELQLLDKEPGGSLVHKVEFLKVFKQKRDQSVLLSYSL